MHATKCILFTIKHVSTQSLYWCLLYRPRDLLEFFPLILHLSPSPSSVCVRNKQVNQELFLLFTPFLLSEFLWLLAQGMSSSGWRGRKFLNCTHLESTSRKEKKTDRLKRKACFMAFDRLRDHRLLLIPVRLMSSVLQSFHQAQHFPRMRGGVGLVVCC